MYCTPSRNVEKIGQYQRFFWPPVENDDYLSAASYRALVIFSVVGFLISCWITTRYVIVQQTELPLITELILFSFPVFLVFPYLLHRKISIKTVGRAFSVYTVFRLSVLAVSFGGIDSTQSLFLIPVVLIATFVLGGKEGFIGLFATFAVYIGLFISQKNHLSSPTELTELKQHFIQLSAVLMMVVGAGATFRHQLVKAVEDLIEAKAIADASSLAKSEFLANMSHEIRTPMNGVLGMADTLKFTDLSSKQEMMVQTIDRSGNALLKIINDILDFSKIEAGKLEMEANPVDIREIIEDVGALLGTSAIDKGIELRTQCVADVPGLVLGDGGRIRQVLINLVGNAVKFTHEGHVTIDVGYTFDEPNSVNLRISVIDTGIGIPEDKVGNIFDKFSQADGSTTRRYGGTGLGLTISKSLVTAMGGEIGVTSEIGKGSTFYIILNLPIVEKAGRTHVQTLHNFTKVPVLVIAGNDTTRHRIVKNLEQWGAETVSAKTGQKALKALTKISQTKFNFPLIVLDSELPDMESRQILEHVNLMQSENKSPVIFIRPLHSSGKEDLKIATKADKALKPSFSTEDLKQATYDLLLKFQQVSTGISKSSQDLTDVDQLKLRNVKDPDKIEILVAEDNIFNQQVLIGMLSKFECKITLVENGKDAYDGYREQDFDIVLMDIAMPVMDGLEATKAIRSYELANQIKPTPIIAVTANVEHHAQNTFIEAGADACLFKPFTKNQLTDIILTHTKPAELDNKISA